MITLTSLTEGYRAWIFGAGGGIGSALASRLEADPRCAAVHAGARSPLPEDKKKHPFVFTLEDEASIRSAVDTAILDGAPEFSKTGARRFRQTGPDLVAPPRLVLS